ncbi:hypothetical protein ACFV5N_11735 [Streptomyces sp. NPDC059853]|uniref:hypothetical protein n=1 Tax=Streptomyces sp. NPDC059853 TaxID=3346973 RepID=UPI003657C7E6
MQHGIAEIDAADLSVLPLAWIGEDIEQEDEQDGWADGPEDTVAPMSDEDWSRFEVLLGQGLDDEVNDACALCGFWSCKCPK